jgi:hypothetical protein
VSGTRVALKIVRKIDKIPALMKIIFYWKAVGRKGAINRIIT